MKMVKSLLLGTAAGLVAVAGAQAADMPVKAKPVQYVKICTLYGDGFYYIPGTDTCIKMGGYLRVQAEYNAGGGGINDGTLNQLTQALYNRQQTNDIDLPRPRCDFLGCAPADRVRHAAHLYPHRRQPDRPRPMGRPAWCSGTARSSSSPASRSARRSRSTIRSPTAAPTATTTCAPSRTPVRRAGTCGPTPPSSATASPARSRWKTLTAHGRCWTLR